MPYIIINDKVAPPHYYKGAGFLIGVGTTDDEQQATRFEGLTAAADFIREHNNPGVLYREGWRVVPVWPKHEGRS